MRSATLKLILPALLIYGCRSEIRDTDAYLKAYREASKTVTTLGEYSLTSMLATPEYLAGARLRDHSKGDQAAFDSLRLIYQGSLFVAFSIISVSKGESPGTHTDVVGAELANGRNAFAEKLNQMQNGMQTLCYLELRDGSKVHPSTYSFDRGWGLRNDVNFLFAFPKVWNGKDIDPSGVRFVIQDFGLNLGNVRHALKTPFGTKLKV